jgi:hypothetical protein
MPARQAWLFRLGCWVALATALAHLAAHVIVPGSLDAAPGAATATPSAVFLVPGLRQPTFVSVFDGFSLSLAVLLATLGGAGLTVANYADGSATLMRRVSRTFALGTAMLLIVSVAEFFSLVTFLIAVFALCFALAAVTETGKGSG